MATSKPKVTQIEIAPMSIGYMAVQLYGTTPLIMHRFSSKAWRELLFPAVKMNAAAKAENLKHDPLTEFRECCYINRSKKEPTLLHYPAGAFTKAIAAAALDLPGASKAQMLRLLSLTNMQINVYGVPMLGMDMVRSSDMARTPDVRTRPYLPEWTCLLEIEYVSSLIGQKQIMNLVGAAGITVGLGDYRPQRGGTFGKFTTRDVDHADVVRLKEQQGRAAQEAAYHAPAFFNDETQELFDWFSEEVARREKRPPSSLIDTPELEEVGSLAAVKATAAKPKRNGRAARA